MKNDQRAIATQQNETEAYFSNISKLTIMKVTSWNLAVCTSSDQGFKQQIQEMVIESLLKPLSEDQVVSLIGFDSVASLN